MEQEDADYVGSLHEIIGFPVHPTSVTFWLSGEYFIGTSLIYFEGSKRMRYWAPAFEDPVFVESQWHLLWKIEPRQGQYMTYRYEDNQWRLLSKGAYDHTKVNFTRQG